VLAYAINSENELGMYIMYMVLRTWLGFLFLRQWM